MRVVSISVNGLARAVDQGFFAWLAGQDADVVCVQDHRMRAYEIEDLGLIPEGYEAYFIDGEKNEHGGVGIYTRHFPKAIMYGYGNELADREGRFIQADFDKVSVACVLAPCALGREDEPMGEDDLTELDHKDEFLDGFGLHLQKTLRKRRQFIFCANLQTAHHVTDASPLYHKRDFSGFLAHERAWLDRLIDELGCVDAFREINKQSGQYTWWPEQSEGARRNAGIRVDYQLLTPGIRKNILDGWIDDSTRFSDHAPVIMEYDIDIGF
ncbi:exodeoxyribonuclease III [Marinobacter salinisoli]|uniref:Exodeoxyribonuclease III n=1 Tax=Marinobacter salinisoli TaxID=2769486 RepID=A0ABX7N0H0_9GAMM|nr:exodeoxyribonuclease III [Marinobacter salinisoli]QSP95928.1 exodeoxyribonuclease III [Marinobacter salinisoli]